MITIRAPYVWRFGIVLMAFFHRFIAFCRASFIYFFEIEGTLKAGALAYATLISVVPLMVLSLGFLLVFPKFTPYFDALHKLLFRHLVPGSAQIIQQYVETFAQNALNLSAGSLFIFLLTAVLLIFSMETLFNAIYKVKTRRKGLSAFLMYWAILTLMPPIALTTFGLTIFISSLPYLSSVIHYVTYFIPFILSWLGFLLLYMTVPNCKVKLRGAAIGALVAALLFEVMKAAFQLYALYFSADALIYGFIAAIPSFLLWLYITWLIVIFGAVISYKMQKHHLNMALTSPN